MASLRFFCADDRPEDETKNATLAERLKEAGHEPGMVSVESESAFTLLLRPGIESSKFLNQHRELIRWLLAHTPFQTTKVVEKSALPPGGTVIEIGPRVAFKTAFCTNAMSVFEASGIHGIERIEKSTRYRITGLTIAKNMEETIRRKVSHIALGLSLDRILELLGDRMTECIYGEIVDFSEHGERAEFFEIDVLGDPKNLDRANEELGLAFDAADLEYYKDLYINKFKRNPTDVELFDLAQSDSEHSRHWFFRGNLFVDGKLREKSLLTVIRESQEFSNPNNLIAFEDNSSAIRGFEGVKVLAPKDPTQASDFHVIEMSKHLLYTAETHNFPTAVCPFQGATTGTGGRIRDVHSTGRGAHEIAGTVGYSFADLHLPGYNLPWEDPAAVYPANFAPPREIAIRGSDGCSDYGNKFGEPVLCGFARSFDQRLPSGERVAYLKPILFSGGIGTIDEDQLKKEKCAAGQKLAKIGGPVYRIGVGGGAASSVTVQGSQSAELDFSAVQRGDAEMEQKLHRLVRACIEMGKANPILAIHDQGAGGNGNVLKELVEGKGAVIEPETFELGDPTISARELWTAEYQENDAILVDSKDVEVLKKISARERCPAIVVGTVTEEQRVVVKNFKNSKNPLNPVDFNTKELGSRPPKKFHLTTRADVLVPLEVPKTLTLEEALNLVLRLPSIASKRYLTCKVDRSVTGLVAQQQCVGPLHTPLADVAVVALSHFDTVSQFMNSKLYLKKKAT